MDNFETLLKEKGLTKTAFSDMLGIKKQNLNALLRNPTLETIKRFAKVLDVPIWRLFAPSTEVGYLPELTALIESKGNVYKATSADELKTILKELGIL